MKSAAGKTPASGGSSCCGAARLPRIASTQRFLISLMSLLLEATVILISLISSRCCSICSVRAPTSFFNFLNALELSSWDSKDACEVPPRQLRQLLHCGCHFCLARGGVVTCRLALLQHRDEG